MGECRDSVVNATSLFRARAGTDGLPAVRPTGRRIRRSVAASFAILALSSCASAPHQQIETAADAIRVMSFNIRYGTAADGDNAWPLRRALAFAVVRDFAPTVLGVQEALRFQLDELRSVFAHLGEVGVGRDDGVTAGEYSAILYDSRRLRVLDSGTFWLSDTPGTPGSRHWGNRITRIATWARFHDTSLDATFYVFNTHWDHESQRSRERSARLLIDRINDRPHADPVIVTGDFNAGEHNPAVRALLAVPDRTAAAPALLDVFRVMHPDARDAGTFNAFRGDRSGERIDAILVTPDWRITDAGIVHYSVDGRYPSDHFPVTAVIRLP
jgi:endonuclease/exonuclease/phosphatase family metal-dependent hydrolase